MKLIPFRNSLKKKKKDLLNFIFSENNFPRIIEIALFCIYSFCEFTCLMTTSLFISTATNQISAKPQRKRKWKKRLSRRSRLWRIICVTSSVRRGRMASRTTWPTRYETSVSCLSHFISVSLQLLSKVYYCGNLCKMCIHFTPKGVWNWNSTILCFKNKQICPGPMISNFPHFWNF